MHKDTMSAPTPTTTAAAALCTLTSKGPQSLPTWCEIGVAAQTPGGVLALLLSRRILAPLDRPCPSPDCYAPAMPLRAITHPQMLEGIALRCDRCKGEWGVRHGSVLERSRQPLSSLAHALLCVQGKVAIAQVVKMSKICYDSVSQLYRDVRNRMWRYMLRHPVTFDEDEIVEIDECYLRFQQREGEVPKWIIGMIGRNSGHVALEEAPDHKWQTMQRLINKHVNRSTTITITDRHASFLFLEEERRHFWCEKRKKGSRLWLEVDDILLCDHFGPGTKVEFGIHTNTIEGFWSHFRKELRGVQDNTIHLYMAEIMYRRLGIDLIHAISL